MFLRASFVIVCCGLELTVLDDAVRPSTLKVLSNAAWAKTAVASGMIAVFCGGLILARPSSSNNTVLLSLWTIFSLSALLSAAALHHGWPSLRATLNKGRELYIANTWTAVTLIAILIAVCSAMEFMDSLGRSDSLKQSAAVLAVALVSVVTTVIAAARIKQRIRSFFKNMVIVAYWLSGLIFYFCAGVTAFAVLAAADDQLSTFLTAPIGTKPDHVYSGFGSDWELYLGCSVLAYLLFRALRVCRDLAKQNVKTPASYGPDDLLAS